MSAKKQKNRQEKHNNLEMNRGKKEVTTKDTPANLIIRKLL